jgi:hypothetical protein
MTNDKVVPQISQEAIDRARNRLLADSPLRVVVYGRDPARGYHLLGEFLRHYEGPQKEKLLALIKVLEEKNG